MRTLSSTLLAAQKKADRLPYIEAKVYDYEQGIKRLSWTRLYEGSEPDNHHGIAFDGQGSMHRIRAEGNNLYYQKAIPPFGSLPTFPMTFPIPLVSSFDTWQLLADNCYGPCAIAAYGAKVYIFYRTTGNVLWKYYSHDYGVSWSNAQLVSYADVLSLAATWWGTGNIVVCFALKASQLNGITLDTSTQTATQHTWSDANHPLLDTYGIGAAFDAFWPACLIVFAGKESDSPYNHYDLFRTQFSDTYNFLALQSFLSTPVGENITYEYPDCHLPSSAQDYETVRITAVEKFTGTTAYTRPLACHLVKDEAFSSATFTEPKPFLNISSSYGLRLKTDSSYWWLERPDGVWRAPRPAGDPLDLTKDIISLTQRSSSPSTGEGQGEGALIIQLDNSKGKYAPGSVGAAALAPRSEVVLKLGYKTSAGSEAVEVGRYWLDAWEYSSSLSRSPSPLRGEGRGEGVSTFTLYCLDGHGLSDRWAARYHMTWGQVDFPGFTVWQILHTLLCRWGIRLWNKPGVPQSTAINNFYPAFSLNSGTQGDAAVRRLLSFVPDGLIYEGYRAWTKDLKSDESSSYSYKFPSPSRGEGQGEGAIHPILSGQYSETVPLSRARALGRDSGDNRIVQDALDWTNLALGIDILKQAYDPNLQNNTRTQERADALLREESLKAQQGNLVIPVNVGQELYDVITITDSRVGLENKKYRVMAIETDYDRSQGRYEQKLTVGAP